MNDKHPKIYKNKIDNIKAKTQKDFYFHFKDNSIRKEEKITKENIITKINNLFSSPNFVYQASVNIMYKNGNNINKIIVGRKDNYLITMEGEKIYIDEIYDIK